MTLRRFAPAFSMLTLLLFAAPPPSVDAQDDLPWVGTWRLNAQKSGSTARSATRVHEVFEGNGLKYHAETIGSDGSKVTQDYADHFDGRDIRWMTAGGTGDYPATISMTRVDSHALAYVLKNRDGVVLARGLNAVSRDGRTLTITAISPQTGMIGEGSICDKQ